MTRAATETLTGLLRIAIESDGPMTFDRFMEYALYHPRFGYYGGAGAGVRAGPHGDFVTAPTLTPLFGRALARFTASAWQQLGKPPSWWWMEAGSGGGALAAPHAAALAELGPGAAHGMHVALADHNEAHREEARTRLAAHVDPKRLVVGADLPMAAGRPCVIVANELLDNLPVRLLRRVDGAWQERCVDATHSGTFDWVDVAAPKSLAEWADAVPVPVPDDHQIEVPVGAHQWLAEVTDRLGSAPTTLLLIDYGETARDLFGEPRHHGTLTAYAGHKQDRDVLRAPGERDITAHVNWSDVARSARALGWHVAGYTTQGSFLSDLGLLKDAAALGATVADVDGFAALQAVKEVLLPGGMGEQFKVLLLTRGVSGAQDVPWPGFSNPRALDPPVRRSP